MNTDLSEFSALVGGSTNGIGWACALELASLGASVTLMSRNKELLAKRLGELPRSGDQQHGTLVADFSDADGVHRTIQDHLASGAMHHIYVHNSGGPPEGRTIDCSPEDYRDGFTAHLVCPHIVVQALVPGMRAAGYGRIITITSTSAKVPIQPLGVSNVIRAGVANWIKGLSMDLGPDKITANNVLPGFTNTARLESLVASWSGKAGITPEAWIADKEAMIPLRRFGETSEIAAAVAFLASPAASYISGINVPVDGGRLPTL